MPRELKGQGFTDAKLKSLPKLDGIRTLALLDTAVTDSGSRELLRARALEEIEISSDIRSDSVLHVLAQLPALQSSQIHRRAENRR